MTHARVAFRQELMNAMIEAFMDVEHIEDVLNKYADSLIERARQVFYEEDYMKALKESMRGD